MTIANPTDVLNDIPDTQEYHNGGTLRFGPDGMLYASLGDDFLAPCGAQDLSQLRGKILRLAVAAMPDTGAGPPPKSLITPPDNPFVGDPSANGRLVYALGLRNPFRFTVDPASGELFAGEVGAAAWEEVDRVDAGDNLGWPRREGAHSGPQPSCPGSDGEDPIAEYPHDGLGPLAVIGGPRYRHVAGAAGVNDFPADYGGDVFFADYYRGFIRRWQEVAPGSWAPAPPAPGQPDSLDWAAGITTISDLDRGPDGALWYLQQFAPPSLRRIRGTPSASVGGEIVAPPGAGPAGLVIRPNPVRREAWRAGEKVSILLSAGETEHASRDDVPHDGDLTWRVFDARGRLVRTLSGIDGSAGGEARAKAEWDGRDDRGRLVPAGVYFVAASGPAATFARLVVE